MREIELAKLKDKDGVLVRSRSVVLPTGTELSGATPSARITRDEAEAGADHISGEVPRARANHPPADSETD